MNQFGVRISELRISQNIKQRQIAAVLETDTAFISKMETGKKYPRRDHVIKLAVMLKAEQEELLSLWLADKV
jgi:transcriptional regulator with XRE-family HTH domain